MTQEVQNPTSMAGISLIVRGSTLSFVLRVLLADDVDLHSFAFGVLFVGAP